MVSVADFTADGDTTEVPVYESLILFRDGYYSIAFSRGDHRSEHWAERWMATDEERLDRIMPENRLMDGPRGPFIDNVTPAAVGQAARDHVALPVAAPLRGRGDSDVTSPVAAEVWREYRSELDDYRVKRAERGGGVERGVRRGTQQDSAMAADAGQGKPRIQWEYSKTRDVLVLWSETEEGETRRIQVSGTMVRQLTSGVAFGDIPRHRQEYILNELYARPRAYGGKG